MHKRRKGEEIGRRKGRKERWRKKDPQTFLDIPASCHDSSCYFFSYLYPSPPEIRTNTSIFLKQKFSSLSYPYTQP